MLVDLPEIKVFHLFLPPAVLLLMRRHLGSCSLDSELRGTLGLQVLIEELLKGLFETGHLDGGGRL